MEKPRTFTVLTDLSLITCIAQRGAANEIVKAAVLAGAQGATVYFASGSGMRERLGLLGMAVETEKEVVNIVVPSEQADRIFEVMYKAGKLDTPGMGFIYITPLEKAAAFIPSHVISRLQKKG